MPDRGHFRDTRDIIRVGAGDVNTRTPAGVHAGRSAVAGCGRLWPCPWVWRGLAAGRTRDVQWGMRPAQQPGWQNGGGMGMCGFCGFTGHPDDRESVLERMMARICHRGPDDRGTYLDENIALGFRRLSIIGLTDICQPLRN